jgi:hypothetical protein
MSCSEPPPVPASQPAPKSYRIQLESLATVQSGQPTHITVGGDGTTYFVQERPRKDDVMFVIPARGVAQASNLTSQRVASALGYRAGVSGNLQSLAVDPAGRVYFFFAGGTKRTNLSCFGVFDPTTDTVQILADNPTLAKATLMGDSFNLARGTVSIAGDVVWLAVQNPAMAAVFRFQIAALNEAKPTSFIPAFTSLQTPFGKTELAAEEISFAAHPSGSLLVTDRYTGSIWQVNSVGQATLLQNLVGAPENLATAGADAAGNCATFLNDGRPIIPRMEGHVDPAEISAILPIFLFRRGNDTMLMGKEMFQDDGKFAIFVMSLQQLVADAQPDRWVGYDRNSGELLRLRLIPVR